MKPSIPVTVTGRDDGLSQDYNRKLGAWFADRLGAREQLRRDFPPLSRPSSPCIAICSTSQGDNVCKGCGRTFTEVCLWLEMTPEQHEHVWQRIETERTALRFTTYSERVL